MTASVVIDSPASPLASTFRGGLTPEQELLLLLVQHPEAIGDPQRAAELGPDVDGENLYALANRHRVEPIVFRNLSAHLAASVDPKILKRFKAHFHASVRNHLLLNEALSTALTAFEDAGIEIIPFKGPVLSHLLYDQIGLRVFSDVDVLIHRADFGRAKSALLQTGFEPLYADSPESEARRLATQMGLEFINRSMNTVIEVHWQFLHNIHAFDLPVEGVWERSSRVTYFGAAMRQLSHEDHLVYLCAHGCKHYWENLNWICDIAHFLDGDRTPVDWQAVKEIAAEAKGERMLYLGLNLAHRILQADLPEELEEEISSDEAVERLTRQVVDWVFTAVPKARLDAEHRRFHLEMRERVLDRLPYYWHLARLAVQPTDNDLTFVDLPRPFGFLYYAVRPIRLIRDWFAGASEERHHMRA